VIRRRFPISHCCSRASAFKSVIYNLPCRPSTPSVIPLARSTNYPKPCMGLPFQLRSISSFPRFASSARPLWHQTEKRPLPKGRTKPGRVV